ncbi:glycosyltransferase family 2 protein [Lacibacter luteus]|uniref:glycosyltransferase family 2 protein n=1 Tax=Lacibacter luteus TaxID=2508719 RepID=UPI0013E94984|nr:glycosyltransferase family 2 protein [Lacibacter luteus]
MNNSSTNKPFISVCTVTYNQEQFIAQCIESVLMQQTDFDWELIIGDDGSTDGTGAICQAYAAAYPHRIRYYCRNRKNRPQIKGVHPNRHNLLATFAAANGHYLAWLDGDDYYTDALQLQKVKQFFVNNKSCRIVFTEAQDVDAAGGFLFNSTENMRRNLYPQDLIFCGPVTSSLVMEQAAVATLLQQPVVQTAPALDQFFMAVLSCNSFMGYVATSPVCYRYHDRNLMKAQTKANYYQSTLGNALAMYTVLGKQCHAVIRKRIIIACRTNLNYNLRHINARLFVQTIKQLCGYILQSGDCKFFIDFWNTKLLYQRSS